MEAFTYQHFDTRFPVPDHQFIPVVIVITVTVIVNVYEQYTKIVPADPNRMRPVDVGNSREVFKGCIVPGQSVLFTS